jgi:mono/diheme cytochrome c family protein
MMRRVRVALFIVVMAAMVGVDIGCGRAPGQESIEAEQRPPNRIADFTALYRTNCAGCHGPEGRGGAAMPLADPIYLALADDAVVRRVTAEGIPGSLMPAFARRSGGMLTDEHIDAIVSGIRSRWADPKTTAGLALPPYTDPTPGDAQRGSAAFAVYCARCHGERGEGASADSSIVAGAFLALVSDQGLRTTIIAGRPDLHAPDWRGNVPGHPMSPQDISDVVAWLAAQRPEIGGAP